MSEGVYILINVTEEKAGQVARMLRGQPGVKMIDLLEGPPDVVVILQARSRHKLANLTNRALALVDSMTEGIQVLPVRTGYDVQTTGE